MLEKPMLNAQESGSENQQGSAALVADLIDENKMKKLEHNDDAPTQLTTNGHTHRPVSNETCEDHTKDGTSNSGVGPMTDDNPLHLPRAKKIDQVIVDNDKDDKANVPSTIEIERDDTNSSNSHQDSSPSPAMKKGENEDESSTTSSSLSSSSSSSSASSESSEESSLLSSWSEDSSLDGVPSMDISSKYRGLKRLEKKLERRKERLKRLCVGQPQAYVRLLKSNEELAGKLKIAEYIKQHPEEDSKGRERTNATVPSPTNTTISSLPGILQFEWLHTLPCAYAVFILCLAHTVFYGVLECFCRVVHSSCFQFLVTETTFYAILIFIGLLLLRINGGLFYYSSTTRGYFRIKMEMSNRLKVGMLDARLFKRISGTMTDSSFNMFGYYLVSIGINYFYYNYHYHWMGQHTNWVEGIWSRASELVNAEIIEKQNEWEGYSIFGANTYMTNEQISPTCEIATNVVSSPILRPLYKFWCTDSASEYKSFELAYHSLLMLIVAGLSYRISMNVLQLCD